MQQGLRTTDFGQQPIFVNVVREIDPWIGPDFGPAKPLA